VASLLEKYASRLKADQRRFRDRQTARLREVGIDVGWTISSVHATATPQWKWEYRNKFDRTVYADWRAEEIDGHVIVTRTEYGYLPKKVTLVEPRTSASESASDDPDPSS
jgi:hypothetical protein